MSDREPKLATQDDLKDLVLDAFKQGMAVQMSADALMLRTTANEIKQRDLKGHVPIQQVADALLDAATQILEPLIDE